LNLEPTAIAAVGIMIGSEAGARLQKKVSAPHLKRIFAVLLFGFALRMIWYAFVGGA
jgi:uncharacterized membrane protein YfcA